MRFSKAQKRFLGKYKHKFPDKHLDAELNDNGDFTNPYTQQIFNGYLLGREVASEEYNGHCFLARLHKGQVIMSDFPRIMPRSAIEMAKNRQAVNNDPRNFVIISVMNKDLYKMLEENPTAKIEFKTVSNDVAKGMFNNYTYTMLSEAEEGKTNLAARRISLNDMTLERIEAFWLKETKRAKSRNTLPHLEFRFRNSKNKLAISIEEGKFFGIEKTIAYIQVTYLDHAGGNEYFTSQTQYFHLDLVREALTCFNARLHENPFKASGWSQTLEEIATYVSPTPVES